MKRVLTMVAVLVMCLISVLTVYAEEGNVTYHGSSREFIFAPGSEYSPTDLFPNFKDVMPGDHLTQPITVRNDKSKNVKVKVYIRSLGAHEDSVDFLSQLHMTVSKSQNNQMSYMFDAAADVTDGMTDWVYLGTLYSGGEVNLDVTLDVPVTLDNTFKNLIGYLDWEFKIEELPVEPDDPRPPQTGDDLYIYLIIMIVALILLIILFLSRRKNGPGDRK